MEGGASYEDGVRAAQESGIAETDPTLDVDGWDAAAKAVIIGRSLFGGSLTMDDVDRTGIRGVTQEHLAAARERGNAVKLIVRVRRTAEGVRASVAPEERSRRDVLGNLEGQEMGVVFKTQELGDVASTVKLTGGVPTALAVLRDIINLARDRGWTARP
jgi:homoserine dehydrogenase